MTSKISFGAKRLFSNLDQSPTLKKPEIDNMSPFTKKSIEETFQDFTVDECFSPENLSAQSDT